jgi:CRISPR-associated endonuclease/helicase Cas3
MDLLDRYYRYWGKAHPVDISGTPYHLLVYHSLDVAAVGRQILEVDHRLLNQLAAQLSMKPKNVKSLLVWALSLHDIGKFARVFQNLAPDMSDALVSSDKRKSYSLRHDSLGYLIWSEALLPKYHENGFGPLSPDHPALHDCLETLDQLLQSVTGHHGQPPVQSQDSPDYFFHSDDITAVLDFIEVVSSLLLVESDVIEDFAQQASVKKMHRASWLVAGWAVLADWIGSDQSVFQYQNEVVPLERYWTSTCHLATEAVHKAGLATTRQVTDFQSIQATFPFITQPTPLQQHASEVEIATGPHLFILEDVTGSGKTEAAIVLTHRLMSAGLGQGLYVALPTMATANAMYARMAEVYRSFFSEDDSPSLVLAHGKRQHSTAFQESVSLSTQEQDKNYGFDERSASAFCNAWIADSKKKALLADVGIGTLDQALLAVLPVRHQSLRYFGLRNKILIVDEVHAYDAYMNELLQQLISLHASAGGSVILMTATLPQAVRQKLSDAFLLAADLSCKLLESKEYPLITAASRECVTEQPLQTRPSVWREVKVQRLADEAAAMELILGARKAGQCACWIRNTVGDAISSYRLLQTMGVPRSHILLFHSRFAMSDRLVIEQMTLDLFGKTSGADERSGRILIATQVVEQSLDLDFDVLITDLAPVDLLIQRAGRLHRHVRDLQGNPFQEPESNRGERPAPILHVLSPEPVAVPEETWIKDLLPGSSFVYPHVGQLWLTARVLFSQAEFLMPEDARRLIESVYGEAEQEEIPEALLSRSREAEGQASSHTAFARLNSLKLKKGYTSESALSGWSSEVDVSTRLSDETVTVAIAKVRSKGLLPYATGASAWSLSQINVRASHWRQILTAFSESDRALALQARLQEKALEWVEVLPLTENLSAHYSPDFGLLVNPHESGERSSTS